MCYSSSSQPDLHRKDTNGCGNRRPSAPLPAVKEAKHCELGPFCRRLVVAAQQLHAQSDALVPLPGENAHVPGVERGLDDVLLVGVVVDVALEKLQRNKIIVWVRTWTQHQSLQEDGGRPKNQNAKRDVCFLQQWPIRRRSFPSLKWLQPGSLSAAPPTHSGIQTTAPGSTIILWCHRL